MENIALFDFDGTITDRDTFLDFHLFSRGVPKTLLGLAHPCWILSFLFQGRSAAKQKIFSVFWRGRSYTELCEHGNRYARERVPAILKEEAKEAIFFHRKRDDEMVIVTASLKIWIESWALDAGFLTVIGTEPEVEDGILTGRFVGQNCRGSEKVRRLEELGLPGPGRNVYAYGDSLGDREMLELAGHSVYRWGKG